MDQSVKVLVDNHDLTCIVCLEMPSVAYTSECCGTLICDKCKTDLSSKNHQSCPQCRNKSPNFQKNTYLMKLINSSSAICRNKCGFSSQSAEMKNHYKICPLRIIECKICQFKAKKIEFLTHVTQKHESNVISLLEENQNSSVDPLKEVKNTNGDISQIGQSSKFYCGKSIGHKCGRCDGNCGPDDGCNCPACMKLDLQYRNLVGKGVLINSQGRVSYYKQGIFYCCMRSSDNQICGQKEFQCRQCQSLKFHIQKYQNLLD